MVFFSIIALFYVFFTLGLYYYWSRISVFKFPEYPPHTSLSVIIPVRNEAENIGLLLKDIEKQNYPRSLFEVLVVNDFSEDQTAQVVEDFFRNSCLNGKLIQTAVFDKLQGKKAALVTGIKQASGTLILTTDGDCRVGKDWLRSIAAFYEEKGFKLITAPVFFIKKPGLFSRMQFLEFSTLIGAGAATLQAGFPSMCNGANLAFEKKTFAEVKGYAGNEAVASGDDEFLLHKISKKFPGKSGFLKSIEAIVETTAPATINSFYNQRKRWASKWAFYKNPANKILAVCVFAFNFCFVALLVFFLAGLLSLPEFLLLYASKFLVEFVFLYKVLLFSKKEFNWMAFIILQFIYPFYVSFFAITNKAGTYYWKGRILK